MSTLDFTGEAGIVTGAASGIGRAVCHRLAELGGRILAVDRDGAALADVVAATQGQTTALELELTDDDAGDRILAAARRELGAVDFVLNNAGVEGPRRPLCDIQLTEWDATVDVNMRATFITLKALVPEMRERGGRILNMGSCLGTLGAPGTSVYSATKHALVGITRCLAAEEAKHGIAVNCLSPGPTETPLHDRAEADIGAGDADRARAMLESMIPAGRYATTEEVAETAVFLLARGHDVLTGATIAIDGGMTAALYRGQ